MKQKDKQMSFGDMSPEYKEFVDKFKLFYSK